MNHGKFIVVEGIEGAGKSTAIATIKETIEKFNISYVTTREPGGTPLAEQLRTLVKSADHQETITQETELLLMYASRSQLLANKILPALEQGTWVIGDRHNLSSIAYQGGGRQISDSILNTLADITLKGLKPDLTIYLDITPELGLSRAQARGELDRIELEQIDFFNRTRDKYLQMAASDNSIVKIDASQPLSSVRASIVKTIEAFVSQQIK
ncbi:dTMP kinase [Thalassotalea marina]|uniref:Thymidylate kinase n=1 Tax=Thalassotalea marina TaxID=1673741 RepID=A0A919BIC4_9GAMM|nr:dTMP kinase [Thalassotalea marina]GHF93140.1 thymidylate kinase [Thalassotalea marina]